MFARLPGLDGVLVCRHHGHAVYGLDEHMKRHHNMPAAERRAQLALYKDAALLPPAEVPLLEPYGRPINELGPAQDGFACCRLCRSGRCVLSLIN
ncbi:hypothetical protein K458DRAFT_180343 [Lentithecium fluviatile CBS 122367]|uniref:Uncharacterized protein n=1 Tax=Lentithecium fluviatile CBS 122367 TaxID=1168545 RepID=A0A6G1IF39_9PLEO|nr:hypothetical protein K458DRAFT_180343 [Lentithecium fluviatile CBS 122367]